MNFASLIGRKKLLTIEFNPPKNPDIKKHILKLEQFKNIADAINVTDSPMAKPRMNSIVSANFVKNISEPIFNLTCRDKNKIAIQSDLLAASALGLKNILAITGDPAKDNDSVYKINVFELIKLIKNLNEQFNTDFFIGCASDIPKTNNMPSIKSRLKRKTEIGVKFVITQPIFSKNDLERFLEASNDIKIHKIIGIMPIVSYKNALYLNNNVKGINIPKFILSKFENASIEDSKLITLELHSILLNDIKNLLPYIEGLHIMKLDYEIAKLTKNFLEV
ncbi:methylenetetrahydrofolate reductase [Desulfurella sp.]|uniref:methylenetetrahydrofolate reductase n=1 Tax=Desulfurella sp. TaxID=1962857 RepID=UPI0025B9A102|nr:methylenetetrahydrofolate reductase [Desulfurella sp.]